MGESLFDEHESALVRLSKLVRVGAHTRHSKKGNSEHVDSYVRKELDVRGDIGGGKTKSGAFSGGGAATDGPAKKKPHPMDGKPSQWALKGAMQGEKPRLEIEHQDGTKETYHKKYDHQWVRSDGKKHVSDDELSNHVYKAKSATLHKDAGGGGGSAGGSGAGGGDTASPAPKKLSTRNTENEDQIKELAALDPKGIEEQVRKYNADAGPELDKEIAGGTPELLITANSEGGYGKTFAVTVNSGIRSSDGGWIAAGEPKSLTWPRRSGTESGMDIAQAVARRAGQSKVQVRLRSGKTDKVIGVPGGADSKKKDPLVNKTSLSADDEGDDVIALSEGEAAEAHVDRYLMIATGKLDPWK
jgi:hypothetical protein